MQTDANLDPAKTILDKIGYEVASKLTETHISRVYRWTYPASRGGTGGLIPQRYHRILLDHARDKGITLAAEDFLPVIPRRARPRRKRAA